MEDQPHESDCLQESVACECHESLSEDVREAKRRKNPLYRAPIAAALLIASIPALVIGIYAMIRSESLFSFGIVLISLLILLGIPPVLTVENLWFLIIDTTSGIRRRAAWKAECFTLGLGTFLTFVYCCWITDEVVSGIRFAHWSEQLYAQQLHSPIEPASLPTVGILLLVSIAGYLILRLVPLAKQPPLLTALSIAALYIGGAVMIVEMVQLSRHSLGYAIILFLFNILLIYARTMRLVICEKRQLLREAIERGESPRLSGIAGLLSRTAMLPLAGFVLAIPLLGVLVLVLTLFGQQPDAIIRAWTETADWTLSQQAAPPNLPYDAHYLCTVAAGGHRRVVKPLRTGKRHGHTVIVNRQLCIANAFEQLLEERTPRFHRLVRRTYDRCGLPVARLIRTQFAADAVYLLMKPAEWFFLAMLYLFDRHPENRIAQQYPHAPVPKKSSR